MDNRRIIYEQWGIMGGVEWIYLVGQYWMNNGWTIDANNEELVKNDRLLDNGGVRFNCRGIVGEQWGVYEEQAKNGGTIDGQWMGKL